MYTVYYIYKLFTYQLYVFHITTNIQNNYKTVFKHNTFLPSMYLCVTVNSSLLMHIHSAVSASGNAFMKEFCSLQPLN